MRNNHNRSIRSFLQSFGKQLHIMAIYFNGFQAEGAEFFCKRLKVGHINTRSKALQPVGINNNGEVRQALVCGEDQALPR